MYFEVYLDETNGNLYIENDLVATGIDYADPDLIGFYVSEWLNGSFDEEN